MLSYVCINYNQMQFDKIIRWISFFKDLDSPCKLENDRLTGSANKFRSQKEGGDFIRPEFAHNLMDRVNKT